MTLSETELRDWLERSQYKGSIRKFALAIGIPLKTAEDWFYENAKPRSPSHRAKLYFATRLKEYAPRSEEEKALFERTECLEKHIKALFDSLELLHKELEYFKETSAEHRNSLRNRLDGQYIAYLSNLLQLLLSEERFQEWLTISSLIPIGTKGDHK